MDRPPSRGRAAWPVGLLGMLALVTTTEALLGRGDRLADDKAASWVESGRAAREEVRGAGVFCLGDSMMKFGVLPRVIEGRTGRAYNLAGFDGPPAAADVLLGRALAAGARPVAVVLNAMPHQLGRDPFDPVHRRGWMELLDAGESLELASAFGRPELVGLGGLGRALASLRCRDAIRATLLAGFAGEDRSSSNIVRLYRRNWRANLGAHVLARSDRAGRVDPANIALFPERWEAHPMALASVRRLLGKAEARGINVFWLISPMHPEAQRRLDDSGVSAAYDRVVDDLAAEFPNVVVLDGRRLGLGGERFADAVHLDRLGAVRLSAAVGEALAGRPGGRRIVLAPARLDPEDGPAVEDIEESRVALREAYAAGRR